VVEGPRGVVANHIQIPLREDDGRSEAGVFAKRGLCQKEGSRQKERRGLVCQEAVPTRVR